jgi:hypothetical protein
VRVGLLAEDDGAVDAVILDGKTERDWLRLVPGNAKGGSITVPLTSCLTSLE